MVVNKSGLWGEVFAARYLRDNGYSIISANYNCRMGEVDIIAEKDGVTAFVEVKTRNENPIATPAESVDFHKQMRVTAAAKVYMREIKEELNSRFDVIEVTLDSNLKLLKINHIKNAF
ncbi:MAG: YraN family protein [Clostridia bacterium]|nr:YraN family protein [Clostridia bacterium]